MTYTDLPVIVSSVSYPSDVDSVNEKTIVTDKTKQQEKLLMNNYCEELNKVRADYMY